MFPRNPNPLTYNMKTQNMSSKAHQEEPPHEGGDNGVEHPGEEGATYMQINKKKKKKKRLLNEAKKAENRGVCYLSPIPPLIWTTSTFAKFSPNMVIFSGFFLLLKVTSNFHSSTAFTWLFLSYPSGFNVPYSSAQLPSKPSRLSQNIAFTEGWVEFTSKNVAKRVANMLNGEQIGGKKRSSFYYDLWNIKYLSKFKWEDLTEELAFKKAVREQKLALEPSAAKRERDFYMSRVDQSRALSAIEERLKKKQKVEQDSGQMTKVIRHFPQAKPVAANAKESKPAVSDDLLDAVFGGS